LFIARADCWWSAGVVGEADGRSKYALAAAERGGDAKAVFDVLQAERRREQRLRDVGADVVRWSTGEVLKEPAARRLAQRIIGAISLAQDGSRFTGVVAPTMLQLTTGPSD
jgi:pimeloyl-CoA synthetase